MSHRIHRDRRSSIGGLCGRMAPMLDMGALAPGVEGLPNSHARTLSACRSDRYVGKRVERLVRNNIR